MNLTSLKQSLTHHESSPNNIRTEYVNLGTPPRRERRVLFAELSSQGGRSTPTPLLFPTIDDAYRITHKEGRRTDYLNLFTWR